MARNRVQFQKGLSEAKFIELYGTEEKCRAALLSWRWSEGFVCPACGSLRACTVKHEGRGLYQCNACRTQTSLTAGTIFHSTKLKLVVWFRAMYLMTQTKQGISRLELSRRLGVRYDTAWKIHHKLAQVMMERDRGKPLDGRVEMDDAYLGGERNGGKRGRGSPGKMPIVIAVETTTDAGKPKPKRVKIRRVKTFSKKHIEGLANSILKQGSRVLTDGLRCFKGLEVAGCTHEVVISGKGRKSVQNPLFKWVNTTLGNIKSSLDGTFRKVSEKHAPRSLAEFEYRYNRRYDLASMIPRLGCAAAHTLPMPYRLLKLAEDYG
jgi:transposase-like protein